MSAPDTRRQRRLLLGLGNDLLTDDAVGLQIVRQCRPLLAHCPDLQCEDCGEMGLSLLDLIVAFDELILVDAVQTGQAPPGYLHRFDLTQMRPLPSRSPHGLGISEVLALGRQLELEVPERVQVLAIEVSDPFTVSTKLTPDLSRALPGLVNAVVRLVLDEGGGGEAA